MSNKEPIRAYKLTRADGRDQCTGTVHYEVGKTLVHPSPDTSNTLCSAGYHVGVSAIDAIRNRANATGKPWRYFEVEVPVGAQLATDGQKIRCSSLTVVREIGPADVFGADLGKRCEEVQVEAATWKTIPWLKPTHTVTDEEARPLLEQWWTATAYWAKQRGVGPGRMPRRACIVRSAADDAYDAYAAYAAYAAAADAAAADDADDAADAAAAAWYYWRSWYVRPRNVLYRNAQWHILGLTTPNPYAPLVSLYKLGVMPIGYRRIDGEVVFVLLSPEVSA